MVDVPGRHPPSPQPSVPSKPTQTLSQASLQKKQAEAFTRAMATLCCLKRTTELTKPQAKHWFAVLQGYRPQTLNRAVIEVGCQLQRFPELSDILQVCRRIEPPERPYHPHGDPRKGDQVTKLEVERIAARLGLDV